MAKKKSFEKMSPEELAELYIGMAWDSATKMFVCKGFVDSCIRELASGKNVAVVAREARGRCKIFNRQSNFSSPAAYGEPKDPDFQVPEPPLDLTQYRRPKPKYDLRPGERIMLHQDAKLLKKVPKKLFISKLKDDYPKFRMQMLAENGSVAVDHITATCIGEPKVSADLLALSVKMLVFDAPDELWCGEKFDLVIKFKNSRPDNSSIRETTANLKRVSHAKAFTKFVLLSDGIPERTDLKFRVGQEVQCLYGPDGEYYTGKIDFITPKGEYFIKWSDNDNRDTGPHQESDIREVFEVKEIQAHRLTQIGAEKEYRVVWESGETTWETEEKLNHLELFREYLRKKKKETQSRKRKKNKEMQSRKRRKVKKKEADTSDLKNKSKKMRVYDAYKYHAVKKESRLVSQYEGLVWREGVWRAQIRHNHKIHLCGEHKNEIKAARMVNDGCRDLGIPIKNPKVERKRKRKKEAHETSQSELGNAKFEIGMKVQCLYEPDGEYYDAEIHSITSKGYFVTWADNDEDNRGPHSASDLKPIRIRSEPEKSGPSEDYVKCVEIGGRTKFLGFESSGVKTVQQRAKPDIPKPSVPNKQPQKKKSRKSVKREGTSSKYVGVFHVNKKSGQKSSKPWRARVTFNGKLYECKQWKTEREAALAVNAKCDELNIPRKNPKVGLPISFQSSSDDSSNELEFYMPLDGDDEQQVSKKESENLVSNKEIEDRPSKKESEDRFFEDEVHYWRCECGFDTWGVLAFNRKMAHLSHGCSLRKVKEEAEKNVKQERKRKVPKKKRRRSSSAPPKKRKRVKREEEEPDVGDPGKKSTYVGVTWWGSSWRANVAHKGKKFYCGVFYEEIDAAHAINLKCDELGVPRKNSEIGDPPPNIDILRKRKGDTREKRQPAVDDSTDAETEEAPKKKIRRKMSPPPKKRKIVKTEAEEPAESRPPKKRAPLKKEAKANSGKRRGIARILAKAQRCVETTPTFRGMVQEGEMWSCYYSKKKGRRGELLCSHRCQVAAMERAQEIIYERGLPNPLGITMPLDETAWAVRGFHTGEIVELSSDDETENEEALQNSEDHEKADEVESDGDDW